MKITMTMQEYDELCRKIACAGAIAVLGFAISR